MRTASGGQELRDRTLAARGSQHGAGMQHTSSPYTPCYSRLLAPTCLRHVHAGGKDGVSARGRPDCGSRADPATPNSGRCWTPAPATRRVCLGADRTGGARHESVRRRRRLDGGSMLLPACSGSAPSQPQNPWQTSTPRSYARQADLEIRTAVDGLAPRQQRPESRPPTTFR